MRMIAGLEDITAGELRIDGEVVNDVEPMDRDIAMAFQNYALYPHMTVYENMAFGLRLRKMAKEEIDRRVREAAEILGITEYLQRKPAAMSGGQRQRVALGRAIVREPKVFLLDEPLSNLDAKLRTQMRSEISKLHQKLQTTFIYVTHDQVEAMTMGTRIVVMRDGFVQQIDTPRNLYNYPVNKFVAGFIGTPQMNFYNGRICAEGDKVRVTFDGTAVDMLAPYEYFTKVDARYLKGGKPVTFGIRLEHVSVDPDRYPFKAKCRVSYVEDLGIDGQVYADFNTESEDTVTESPTKIIIKCPAGASYASGEIIDISLDLSYLHVFDAETEESVAPRIPPAAFVKCEVKGGKLKYLGVTEALPQAINLGEGEYEMRIPVAALTFGGKIKATFAGEENVNGQRLVQTRVDGKAVYALADGDTDVNAGLAVDLKQCAFFKDEEEVESPLSAESVLGCKLVKNKVVNEVADGDKVKKVKETVYSLEIGGVNFDCPVSVAEKILNGGKAPLLGVRFAPDEVAVADGGIIVKVGRVLDYGGEKFAECSFTEKLPPVKKKKTRKKGEKARETAPEVQPTEIERKIFVAVGGDFAAESVSLRPDISKVRVYDEERDIRLV